MKFKWTISDKHSHWFSSTQSHSGHKRIKMCFLATAFLFVLLVVFYSTVILLLSSQYYLFNAQKSESVDFLQEWPWSSNGQFQINTVYLPQSDSEHKSSSVMCFVATVLPPAQFIFALLIVFLLAKMRKHRYQSLSDGATSWFSCCDYDPPLNWILWFFVSLLAQIQGLWRDLADGDGARPLGIIHGDTGKVCWLCQVRDVKKSENH